MSKRGHTLFWFKNAKVRKVRYDVLIAIVSFNIENQRYMIKCHHIMLVFNIIWYDATVIDSIFVKWLYRIIVVTSSVLSYSIYFASLYDSILLLYNVDMRPTLYELLSYNINVIQGTTVINLPYKTKSASWVFQCIFLRKHIMDINLRNNYVKLYTNFVQNNVDEIEPLCMTPRLRGKLERCSSHKEDFHREKHLPGMICQRPSLPGWQCEELGGQQ